MQWLLLDEQYTPHILTLGIGIIFYEFTLPNKIPQTSIKINELFFWGGGGGGVASVPGSLWGTEAGGGGGGGGGGGVASVPGSLFGTKAWGGGGGGG